MSSNIWLGGDYGNVKLRTGYWACGSWIPGPSVVRGRKYFNIQVCTSIEKKNKKEVHTSLCKLGLDQGCTQVGLD